MSITLTKGELPKGTGGRKPKELDAELSAALTDALRETPLTENGRSSLIGDASRTFDTEGKASADGRRYGRAVAETLDKTVRVRVMETAEGSGVFGWALYIPMRESMPAEETKTETKKTAAKK